MYTISILILGLMLSQWYGTLPVGSPEATVSLCALVAQPSEYAGKTVKVKAVLTSGMEFQIFKDDSCPPRVNPATGKDDLVQATFSQSQYDFKSAINKKLTRLLKKKQQAQVTVIGAFSDPGHYFGHQDCCRYQLDVQRLLAVEEVSNSRSTRANVTTKPNH